MRSRLKRRHPQSTLLRSVSVVISLIVFMPFASPAQSADETAVRQLVERFFAAYRSGDIGSLMALWSEKSPNFAAAKQTFQQIFEANKLELKSLTFGRIVLEGGTGSVSVTADISAVNAKTGTPADGFGKMNLTLSVKRDLGPWRIWQYTTAEEDLASAERTDVVHAFDQNAVLQTFSNGSHVVLDPS